MKDQAQFKVHGQFADSKARSGIVTITPYSFSVKPSHSKRTYTYPLSQLAEIVVERVLLDECHESRKK